MVVMDEGLAKIRHARSQKDFPYLKLEGDEYVEFAFFRARAYILALLAGLGAGLIIVLLTFLLVMVSQPSLGEMGRGFLGIILTTLVLVVAVFAILMIQVYRKNRLFVTNKHVIQMVMSAPLASSVNMIDLASVEDVSFSQKGALEKLLRYGTLRLSTVGDETTYTFPYANVSPEELKGVSRLVTGAKKANKEEAA